MTTAGGAKQARWCWRKDLAEFRGLTDRERTGFLLVLEWFENFRLRHELEAGRDAGQAELMKIGNLILGNRDECDAREKALRQLSTSFSNLQATRSSSAAILGRCDSRHIGGVNENWKLEI